MSTTGPIRRVLVPALSLVVATALVGAAQDADWAAYGRDPGGERFSPLERHAPRECRRARSRVDLPHGRCLQPEEGRPTAHEATPLLPRRHALPEYARSAASLPWIRLPAQQRWAFDAQVPRDKGWGDYASRGVSAWRRGARPAHLRGDHRRAPDRARRRDGQADSNLRRARRGRPAQGPAHSARPDSPTTP